MARILWVACAEPGSLFPPVPIALELVRRGHEITVLCEPASQPMFESLGLRFRPTADLSRHLDAFDPTAYRDRRAALEAWYRGYVQSLYADTRRELERDEYDVAMVDPLEPGANFAAEAVGVPFFSYVHWRMRETGLDTWFWFRLWDRKRRGDEAFVEWWDALRTLVGLAPEPRPHEEHVWYRTSPHLTLILGLPELAANTGVLPGYAVRVGPTLWEPPAERPLPDWLDTLGRDRPGVLASISTVGDGDGELVRRVAAVADSEDVDVVLTIPVAGELPSLPPRVRVTSFVPHSALLRRVSAVVSHAGNGTVTRAACAGVPLLLVPGGKDQPEVARGAADAGVAIVLDRERLDTETMRDALRTLLHDRGYHERARSISERAQRYDGPQAAADAVERMLQHDGRLRVAEA